MSCSFGETIRTDLFRSGHAVTYCPPLDAVLSFGGWPLSEELEAVALSEGGGCPLHYLSMDLIRSRLTGAAESEEGQLHWGKITPGVMPRTRHGHHLVCVNHEVFLVGGSYFLHGDSLAPQDMVYDIRDALWYQIEPVVPSRFCASVAVSAASAEGETVVYFFGGLDATKSPTNTLFRVWLPSRTMEEVLSFGLAPVPQFKSCLVCDSAVEVSAVARRNGMRPSGRLFHMDGFLPDTSRVKMLYVMDLATGLWREVCRSPDLVRSQVVHVRYITECSGESSCSRVAHFTMFGGMPSRKGFRKRSSKLCTFNVEQLMWEGSKAKEAPVRGLTAHAVALLNVPCAFSTCDELPRSNLLSLSFGGNEDKETDDVGDENTLGVQTNALHVFVSKGQTLKELVVRQIHKMRIPCHINVTPKPRDEILEELF